MAAKWEYRVEVIGTFWRGARSRDIEALLNQAAEDGWDPVDLAPVQNSSRLLIVLRRPIVAERRRRQTPTWP